MLMICIHSHHNFIYKSHLEVLTRNALNQNHICVVKNVLPLLVESFPSEVYTFKGKYPCYVMQLKHSAPQKVQS